jgi:hypothetical protein
MGKCQPKPQCEVVLVKFPLDFGEAGRAGLSSKVSTNKPVFQIQNADGFASLAM